MKIIDLRSDTVTQPTAAMREAMYTAELGDDVYGEDPTVNRLEELAAHMSGKEAALFTVSGTMGNQVSIFTHAARGSEVICESQAHIVYYEGGGIATLAAAQPRQLIGHNGILYVDDIKAAIRPNDIHQPPTSLICLENTHNRGGGTCYSLEQLESIYTMAKKHNIPVHMDGARVFNAAIATGCSLADIAKFTDSMSICLSKGLCAPVGAIIVGTKEFIGKARRTRKLFGGGMRQAGVIAAAGILALECMVDRLQEDHDLAKYLAQSAKDLGIDIDMNLVQSNIVIMNFADAASINQKLATKNIKTSLFSSSKLRMVTHHGINKNDIDVVLSELKQIVG